MRRLPGDVFRALPGSTTDAAIAADRRRAKFWWGAFADLWSAIAWEMGAAGR